MNESVFEMLIFMSAPIVIHFFAKRPRLCHMLMVKAIGGTRGKSKPY